MDALQARVTRRTFLYRSATLGAGLVSASLLTAGGARAATPLAPASPRALAADTPLSPQQVADALKAEGSTVSIKSWGFGGMDKDVFPQRFREWTEATYGVPVELVWDPTDALYNQYKQANKPIGEAFDVVDKEEDSFPERKLLDWLEKIDQPQYQSVLTNWDGVERSYIVEDGFGIIYQGFEWLGIAARKDKVDPSEIKDWPDLANPKYKGLIITYPMMKDGRARLIFVGILSSLIKNGIVTGELWSEDTWLQGLRWVKQNLEPNILKFVDNNEIRTMMQSGEAGIVLTWGSYVRELQGAEWNLRDDVVVPVYPASGMASDREVITIPKNPKRPVSARVLTNWMLGRDFLMVGWYKDPQTGEERNRWNVTQRQFLVGYAGGINPADRALIPDWAKVYYPEDPAKLSIQVEFPWFASHADWVIEEYDNL